MVTFHVHLFRVQKSLYANPSFSVVYTGYLGECHVRTRDFLIHETIERKRW